MMGRARVMEERRQAALARRALAEEQELLRLQRERALRQEKAQATQLEQRAALARVAMAAPVEPGTASPGTKRVSGPIRR